MKVKEDFIVFLRNKRSIQSLIEKKRKKSSKNPMTYEIKDPWFKNRKNIQM